MVICRVSRRSFKPLLVTVRDPGEGRGVTHTLNATVLLRKVIWIVLFCFDQG